MDSRTIPKPRCRARGAYAPASWARNLLMGGLLTGALSTAANANAQVGCNTPADVTGGIFTVTAGSNIDGFSGQLAATTINAIGYIAAKNPVAQTNGVYLFVQNRPTESVLKRASWTYERSTTASLSAFSLFQINDVNLDETALPPGGIGRYQAITVWGNPCEQRSYIVALPSLANPKAPSPGTDDAGITMHSGLIGDQDPKPSAQAGTKYLGLGRPKFDPGLSGAAAEAETLAYYKSVGTNNNGGGATSGQSIFDALPNLEAFRARYFAPDAGEVLSARYYNEGDLGIGRDMHCNFNNTGTGERACYVGNYAPCTVPLEPNGRCSKPAFGQREAAKAGQLAGDVPFATVAMVERTQIAPGAPNAVFFAVYVCTGSDCSLNSNHTLFSGPVALDNHGVAGTGSNTFNPGNCMACHGSGGSYDPVTHSTTGAYFLPFDQDAFQFLSFDPNSPDSQARLHDTLRKMNKYVATESNLKSRRNAKAMISAWYNNDFENGTFNSALTPTELGFQRTTVNGSTTFEASGELYREVYGKACRGCHISHDALQLSTFSEWDVLKFGLFSKLCEAHDMPMAERTQDLAWDDSVRQSLLQNLGIDRTVCNP